MTCGLLEYQILSPLLAKLEKQSYCKKEGSFNSESLIQEPYQQAITV